MDVEHAAIVVTIVIPTYNRVSLVQRSIESAVPWATDGRAEIIVVDDGSSDNTIDVLRVKYREEIDAGILTVLETPSNLGATGARNLAAAQARGQWMVFLDSDDIFVAGTQAAVMDTLVRDPDVSIIFFRCRDLLTREQIGPPMAEEMTLTLRGYLHDWRWGECIPAIRHDAFKRFPYCARLRGFEGLSYARIIKHVGPAKLSPLTVRAYDQSGNDRLSTRFGLVRRSALLAEGFSIMLREFHRELGLRLSTSYALRAVAYSMLSVFVAPLLRWRSRG